MITELTTEDVVILVVRLRAGQACERWARSMPVHDAPDADTLLRPREDGPEVPGTGYLVSENVVRQGMRRIGLTRKRDLPQGVHWATQASLLAALQAIGEDRSLPAQAIDQVIQVGLFGWVRYR